MTRRLRRLPTGPNQPGPPLCGSPNDNPQEVLAAPTTGAALPKPYYEEPGITIYHGDARAILPLMADRSVDFIFTDPPYGHNNNDGTDLIGRIGLFRGKPYEAGATSDGRPIANDGAEANDLFRFAMREARRLLRGGGCCCCCCCGGGGPDPQFARWSLWMDEAIGFKHAVVWDKGGLGMGWHYRRNYEFVLVAEVPGAPCRWFGGNDVANVIRLSGIKPTSDDHPTPKPAALPAKFIGLHTQEGDLVLDPFAGGGSTLIAAKRMARRAIGIEVDERWAAMSADRVRHTTPPLPGLHEPQPEQPCLPTRE